MNTYGYFNDVDKEYIIKRPDTPIPWINYLGCEKYFGIISNTDLLLPLSGFLC